MSDSSRHRKRRSRRGEYAKPKNWFTTAQLVAALVVASLALREVKSVLAQNKRNKYSSTKSTAGTGHAHRISSGNQHSTPQVKERAGHLFEQQQSAASARDGPHYTADSASSLEDVSLSATRVTMNGGLVLLPSLGTIGTSRENETSSSTNIQNTTAAVVSTTGAVSNLAKAPSWRAIPIQASIEEMPAYLKAVAINAAPKKRGNKVDAESEGPESVFLARRKGVWMGCTPPYHMICKGVYRAIKKLNAVHILDTSCAQNTQWLPLVLAHLKKEFRQVRLTCTDRTAARLERVHLAYQGFKHVSFAQFDPFEDMVKNRTDLVIAIHLLQHETLIRSMKFFKRVKENAVVHSVIYDNYPESANKPIPHQTSGHDIVLLNTFTAPFLFGPADYRYENGDEQPTKDRMEIVCVSAARIFEHKSTPTLTDLMDPALRETKA
jgi:hypothetical protein